METKCYTGFILLILLIFSNSSNATSNECPKEVVVIKSVSNAFRSPGYPIHNYDNNADCSWSIQVPQSYNVELSFPRGFSLQGGTSCPYDFVEIRNGPNVTDRLLGKFCGDVTPSDIHSDGRYMFVRFKSDSTFTSKGFEASFRAVQPACTGTVELSSVFGTVTSPNYPMNYKNDDVCTWVISVPYGHVRLVFDVFSTAGPCEHDYLAVRDGARSNSALKGKFCGSSVPPVLHSSGRNLLIQFASDSSKANKGFSASYTSNEVSYEYIKEKGQNGTIESPGFPSFYPNTEEYRWNIEVPSGIIRLSFMSFDLEKSSSCLKDYLEIRDGPGFVSPVIAKVCGANKPADVYSSGTHLSLIFKSDQKMYSEGFQIKYQKVLMAPQSSNEDVDRSEGLIAGLFFGMVAVIAVVYFCVFFLLLWNNKSVTMMFVLFTGCVLILIAIPMIAIGAVHRKDCEIEDKIPLYLIVTGCILLGCSGSMSHHYKESGHKVLLNIFDIIFLLSSIVWLIIGSNWVFFNYPPDYSYGRRYCHKSLYVFAFTVILVQYFFLGVIAVFLIVLISKDKIFCRFW